MHKNKLKKIYIILIITILILSVFTKVNAVTDINVTDYNPRNYITIEDARDAFGITGVILGALRNISVVVSVIILMIIGVKYIVGSASERAEYKKTMFPYIVGCFMAVAGTAVISYIYDVVSGT